MNHDLCNIVDDKDEVYSTDAEDLSKLAKDFKLHCGFPRIHE